MQHTEPSAVERSLALYRRLLRAYPPAFREQYGDEMARAFRDTARTAWRAGGLVGLIALWARTVADTAVNATSERMLGSEEGVATTRRRAFVKNQILPIVIAIPLTAFGLGFLDLTRYWLLTLPAPNRGWAVILEAILLGLPGLLRPPKRGNKWYAFILFQSIACLLLWFPLLMSVGLSGWIYMAPLLSGSAVGVFPNRREKRLRARTVIPNWRTYAGVACGAYFLLMASPSRHTATNTFLLYETIVNVIAAVLSGFELAASSRSSDTD